MLRKFNLIFFVVSTLNLIFNDANAQLKIFYKNAFSKIKNGNTHIIVKDWDFPGSPQFFSTIKRYWTITKGIDFIKTTDLKQNLKAGDSFFSIESYVQNGKNGVTSAYFYLNFWTINIGGSRRKSNVGLSDESLIAQIPLSVDTQVLKKPKKIKNGVFPNFDFDGGGYFANWSQATLKNYLLNLSSALQTGNKADLTDVIVNKDELKQLRNDVFYVTEDDLLSPQYSKEPDSYTAKLFTNYKYRYKILKNIELDEKITADYEPIYYLLFLHNTTADKVLAIINSHSGETVYLSHKLSNSYYLNADDLKDIYNTLSNLH